MDNLIYLFTDILNHVLVHGSSAFQGYMTVSQRTVPGEANLTQLQQISN